MGRVALEGSVNLKKREANAIVERFQEKCIRIIIKNIIVVIEAPLPCYKVNIHEARGDSEAVRLPDPRSSLVCLFVRGRFAVQYCISW